MDSLDPPSGLSLDSNYPFDQVTNWSATQSPGMGLPLPLLGSPSFTSSLSDVLQPPSWQLDHAPSWQPDNSPSAFASSFLSPLPLSNPTLPLDSSHLLPGPQPNMSQQQPADDFNSSLLGLLGSPGPGLEQPLRLGEDDEEDADGDGDEQHLAIAVQADGNGEGEVEDSGSGSSSEDDSEEDDEEDANPLVAEVPANPSYPLGDLHDSSSAYAQAFALAQSTVNSPYSFAPDAAAYGDPYSLAAQSVATGGEGDDGSVSSPRYHGSGDEETPPTSNSSDHDHTRSPYPHQYQPGGGSYDLKASTSSLSGAPSHYFYPNSLEQAITVSPESTTTYDPEAAEEKPFIPALSRPRSAHLRQSYANEEREIDRLLGEADPDFDFHNDSSSKKRKRSASAHSAASAAAQAQAQMTMAWAPPPPAGGFASSSGTSSRRSISTDTLDAIASGSHDPHLYFTAASTSTTPSSATFAKPKKSKKSTLTSAYADPSLLTSTGAQRKRTEIPAVEDDPTIRPYGCNYEHCPSRARVAALGGPSAVQMRPDGELLDEREAISWRTVRELREHCAEHRRAGLDGGQLPFRCALDPCGKTFKSLAGLRFHFQNASANGHFFVSHEEGEEAPSKKFKACVQPTERSEKCPVEGCSKAFKQAAGLAYHLAHTAGHDMTEELVSTFAATLQSKTRWWYAKMGRTLG